MKITLILSFFIITFSSCSFNKLFLRPTTFKKGTKQISYKSNNDTINVKFVGDNLQPYFIKNSNDTIIKDYTIKSVVFKSTDGNKLNGWLIKPKNIKPKVTLLHFHGNAGFLLSQYQAITPLLKYGFQIFIFDYSGFGFSQGRSTKKNVLKDAFSALDYVKALPEIKNTKLIIYGQSLGGHLAVVVAENRQSQIDGLVIEGAFSSHKDIAAYSAGIFGRLLVNEKYSAKKSIKNYKKPLLVIHSTEDKTIPFFMGKLLFDEANEPKEFYEIKKCHICGPTYYSKEISEKIFKMLQIN